MKKGFAKDYIDKQSKRASSSANEECSYKKLGECNTRNITNKDNKIPSWYFGKRI